MRWLGLQGETPCAVPEDKPEGLEGPRNGFLQTFPSLALPGALPILTAGDTIASGNRYSPIWGTQRLCLLLCSAPTDRHIVYLAPIKDTYPFLKHTQAPSAPAELIFPL